MEELIRMANITKEREAKVAARENALMQEVRTRLNTNDHVWIRLTSLT